MRRMLVCKWFGPTQGYGFLRDDNARDGDDIFIHITVLKACNIIQLGEGFLVDCDVSTGKKGKLVTKVHRVFAPENTHAEA